MPGSPPGRSTGRASAGWRRSTVRSTPPCAPLSPKIGGSCAPGSPISPRRRTRRRWRTSCWRRGRRGTSPPSISSPPTAPMSPVRGRRAGWPWPGWTSRIPPRRSSPPTAGASPCSPCLRSRGPTGALPTPPSASPSPPRTCPAACGWRPSLTRAAALWSSPAARSSSPPTAAPTRPPTSWTICAAEAPSPAWSRRTWPGTGSAGSA